jgi:HTH-type transcriptional regulator/antitoxin HipB
MLVRTALDFGHAIRDQRRRLKLDQATLAKRVGVSRKWIIDVEKGKPRAEIGLILHTLEVLGLRLSLGTEETSATSLVEVAPVASADIDKLLERTRAGRR